MKTTRLILSVIGTILILSQCTIDNNVAPTDQTPAYLKNYLSDNRAIPSVYVFESKDGFSRVLPGGSRIYIQPDAFTDKNGVQADGKVSLSVTEILKKSDMIFNNLSTVSASRMLESGGMMHIIAKINDNEVFAKPGRVNIQIPAKGKPFQDMLVFGAVNLDSPVVSWMPQDTGKNNLVKVVQDSINHTYLYSLFPRNLDFINCDHFLSDTPLTSIKAEIQNTKEFDNKIFFLVFQANSAMRMYSYASNGFEADNIPAGMQATLVGMASKKGVLYYCFVPLTAGSATPVKVLLNSGPELDFKNKLQSLD